MKKKLLVVIMAMCLLAAVCIGGTLAWLTAETSTITNVFTFGSVNITLTEEHDGPYTIVPDMTVTKDPLVTITAGSEACWVFVKVEETNIEDVINYTVDTNYWTALAGEDGVYYHEQDEKAVSAVELPVLAGNQVTVETLTEDEVADIDGEIKLSFTAYAIQDDDGFTSAALAWAALDAQLNPVTP